ncbi:hypothetical protein COJ96_02135 [Bacillus sp. AFS073361]|nr:hypothetical protein COJ96_02135 [Bacillus sp. AFS073361]
MDLLYIYIKENVKKRQSREMQVVKMKRYNRHLLELEIEVIRSQLIKTASEKGISHPDVLSLSQLLDSRIIALQKSDSPTV